MTGRDLGTSVCARRLNQARAEKQDFNLVLTRYVLERLLYRLSSSKHTERFLPKGTLLFDLWFDIFHCPTRDGDLLGFGPAEIPSLEAVFRDLCAGTSEPDDGIRFLPETVRAAEIRKEANYAGIRATLVGLLAGARCTVQVDVGFGDALTQHRSRLITRSCCPICQRPDSVPTRATPWSPRSSRPWSRWASPTAA